MATSQLTVHTTEIDITQLPTKSVTFAPTRATVTREIEGIQTQLGANQVTIVGLDPDIDPDSVRVEGYGLATITDIQAEVVPRTQQFQDQYPDIEEEDDDDDTEDESSDNDYGVDNTAVEKAREELQTAESALAGFQNSQDTAVKILGFLDGYGQSMKAQEVDVAKMADFLSVYRTKRTSESETHQQVSTEIVLWQEKVTNARHKLDRAVTAFDKAKDAASREARREREKRARKRLQERLQKQRIIQQRRKFWTSEISQVVVHLDRASTYTPSSSRRNSMVSNSENSADFAPSKPLDKDSINLRLTYVVPSAKWAPRYELKISTPKSSAELVYRAEFENFTSETWKEAKVTFSTSQTFFSGLDDKIPLLEPWHVKLGSAFGLGMKNSIAPSSLQSRNEVMANSQENSRDFYRKRKLKTTNPNSDVLALRRGEALASLSSRNPPPPPPAAAARAAPAALFGSVAAPQQSHARRVVVDTKSDSDEDDQGFGIDELTLSPEAHSIAHQDSIRQDYGLTTTYDLPGQRTLEPSTVKRRHVIAELHLASIALSHVLIPKLRRAAFLKARITNTTAVSLLRGKAGMTVDGAFLGSTTLPSCEPGHYIDLSLGVDPTVLVTYAKPTARRSTTGFFSKEDSTIFTRSCWIKNTKKHDVSITVLDQIPVSEDEHLRINILEPKGLDHENGTAKLHDLLRNGEKGTGEVELGKNGQVKWNLKLRPGKDVKLVLEYESRIPSGQQIVGLD